MIKKGLTGLLICGSAVFATEQGISIRVTSNPALPTANLMPDLHKNWNFEAEFTGWASGGAQKAVPGKTVKIVEGKEPNSKALFFDGYACRVWAVIPVEKFVKGKAYIASCMIKPGKNLPSTGELGFGITFWDKNWKGAASIITQGDGPEQWHEIVGKPVVVPENAANCQISVGMGYTKGSGCVDDLCLREAYAQMKIDVTAPNPIRQVKVMDHFGHTVYDTDVIKNGGRSFAKEIRVETPYTYTILVVTSDGDVKTVIYPAEKNGRNSGKAE